MSFLFRLLALLPLVVLHNLGAICGWIAWLFSSSYRKHVEDNLRQAGFLAVRSECIIEQGKTMLELPRLWRESLEENMSRIVKVNGWQHVQAHGCSQGKKNDAKIFLSPHLGCFELSGQFLASRLPLTSLYREPRQAWLAPLQLAGRSKSMQLAAANRSGVRQLIKALRNGETIGILPDQVPSAGDGIWVPFFNRPAYSMTLAARLSETGAKVFTIWTQRLSYGAGFIVHVQPMSKPLSGDITERCKQINEEMEKLIRQHPQQYLWGYNRYKCPSEAPPPLQGEPADAG